VLYYNRAGPGNDLVNRQLVKCDKYLPDSARIEFAAETEEEQSKHIK
jgi:hypothetical protein